MPYMYAARTNLSSNDVRIESNLLGEGVFRTTLAGTYIGGNRNNQEAACKRFKPQYRRLEDEYFSQDFRIADKVIDIATEWNNFCPNGKEILVNKGSIHYSRSGIKYLVEPFIRYFKKFTSNNGWIGDTNDWEIRCMEAFTHYSYHRSGGQMIICDLQGRYKHNRYARGKSRFEITDPAICSRHRSYGPTDLGAKGIDSFFANHTCNEFCESHWHRPRYTTQWFPRTHGSTMVSSQLTSQLQLNNPYRFKLGGMHGLQPINEDDSDLDSYDEDDW